MPWKNDAIRSCADHSPASTQNHAFIPHCENDFTQDTDTPTNPGFNDGVAEKLGPDGFNDGVAEKLGPDGAECFCMAWHDVPATTTTTPSATTAVAATAATT